jgi:ubiquinone biosynthesis protein
MPREVIQSLPRRRRIEAHESRSFGYSFKVKSVGKPKSIKASNLRTLGRLFVWTWAIFRFFLRVYLDRWARRDTPASRAVLLRKMLENMGPTAIKVGQQLSVRADMLPYQYCQELSKMLDKMPPMDFPTAAATIEKCLGAPLNRLFQSFDNVPIGSASLACVYQAFLHSGELVAVKVKRPGIGQAISNDLAAVGWLCALAEWTGIIRPGITRNFRAELTRMLSEELDFALEARYTEIFRKQSKHNKYISAPRVYYDYCGDDVIVTEFVSGVFLIEVLNALNENNQEALANFRRRGYDFKKLSKRMMRIFHWEVYETHFFHADPHPANLIVRPDNTLVMIDFGSCGSVSSAMRRKFMQFHRQLCKEDIHAMALTTISIFEPLPPIDTEAFCHVLTTIYRRLLLANESRNATWEEKCSGGMWMKVISACRDFNIPMNLDTLRIFRATFMYDSMIYRMNPKLDPRKEFQKWEERYHKHSRKYFHQGLVERLTGPLDSDYSQLREFLRLGEQTLNAFQKFIDTPKFTFGYSVSKVAFVFSSLIKSSIRCLEFFFVACLLQMAYLSIKQSGNVAVRDFVAIMGSVLRHPAFIVPMLLYILHVLQRMIMRMDDIDTK